MSSLVRKPRFGRARAKTRRQAGRIRQRRCMVESLERRQLLAGDAMLPCEAYPSGSQGSEWADLDNLMISATPAATEALAEFTPLGFLLGATSSDPRGMSADGRYIVGVSGDQAYRWSRDQGMIDLGNFKADAVSHDGSVVVGGDGVSNGYRWENGTLSVVGDLTTIGRTEDDPGGTRMASVHRVSADGSVMVGNTAVIDGEADSFRLVGSEIQP